jgi:hypothetical protein
MGYRTIPKLRTSGAIRNISEWKIKAESIVLFVRVKRRYEGMKPNIGSRSSIPLPMKKLSMVPPHFIMIPLMQLPRHVRAKNARPCKQPHVARNFIAEPYMTIAIPPAADIIQGW